ncbi:MAG: hypothetical protein AB1567_09815 [bacterium]
MLTSNGFYVIIEIESCEDIMEEYRLDGIEKRIALLLQSQQEFAKRQEKTDEEIKRLSREVGKVTDSLGRFAEGLVAPCLKKIFKNLGVEIMEIFPRCKAHMNGKTLEIDILCVGKVLAKNKLSLEKGKKVAILSEVKSFLHARQITDFINNDIPQFYLFFEEYKDYPIIGIVSGMMIEEGAERYAEKEGLYVLVPSEDTVKLFNPKSFKPKIWNF